MHQTTCRGPSYGNTQQEPDWTILRSKVKVKYAKNPIFKHGVPHSSFIYRPNRLKMHQTTCRGPSYGNTQQEPDWTILRSKVKVKYAKNPIFKHGVPHSSFIYRPNRLKTHHTTCRGPAMGTLNKNLIEGYLGQRSRSIMRKIIYFHTLSRTVCTFTVQIGSKHENFLSQDPSSVYKSPKTISRSKVKVTNSTPA